MKNRSHIKFAPVRSRFGRSLVVATAIGTVALVAHAVPAMAGPPYMPDDPEPTDYQHFEIYAFGQGTIARGDTSGQSGIDFNYGGAPNLQLTASVPMDYDLPSGAAAVAGLGNVELAAKYRFLTQQNFGVDVAVFPRIFLPSASPNVGDQHASLLPAGMAGKRLGQMVGVRRRWL
jgi:hypothetical protein